MKLSRKIAALSILILLSGCAKNVEVNPPEQAFRDLKQGLEIAEASIVSAGFVVGELVASGDISEAQAEELYTYGGRVLASIHAAITVADVAESFEAGRKTLLAAISDVVDAIGEALEQFDLPREVRIGLVATRAGLTVLQAVTQ